MSIKLNNVIFEHIRYRFEQWSRELLLIGEKDAVSNGVALAYWHLLILNGKKWCWTPVRKIVNELRRRGIEVKKHNKREYSFIVEDVLFALWSGDYMGVEDARTSAGYPENAAVCASIPMEPGEYADFIEAFTPLIPEIKSRSLVIAAEVNESTRLIWEDAVERVADPKHNRHPVIDQWIPESNFGWGDNGERLLVGIGEKPLVMGSDDVADYTELEAFTKESVKYFSQVLDSLSKEERDALYNKDYSKLQKGKANE